MGELVVEQGVGAAAQVGVHIGVVTAVDIVGRGFQGHVIGIAEDDGTAGIVLGGEAALGGEVCAPLALVAQRPEENRGVVAITLDHLLKLADKAGGKFGIGGRAVLLV